MNKIREEILCSFTAPKRICLGINNEEVEGSGSCDKLFKYKVVEHKHYYKSDKNAQTCFTVLLCKEKHKAENNENDTFITKCCDCCHNSCKEMTLNALYPFEYCKVKSK